MRRAVSISTNAVAVAAVGSSNISTSVRTYVPIYEPDAPVDHMSSPRMQDQLRTLWGSTEPRIPNTSAAIDFLRRCGINPAIEQKLQQNDSIFSQRAEDYYGTNLFSFASKSHEAESMSYWTSYYEKKYITAMRMFRRTSTSVIGTADGNGRNLVDEADNPDTRWEGDSYFREVAFIAASFLQTKVSTLEEFEKAVRNCTAEQFLQFIRAYRYQTLTLAPLPSAACWSMEGEQLVKWVNMWKPLQLEATNNFNPLLLDAAKQHSWQVIAEKLAAAYKRVFDVLAAREERQIASGLKKAWAAMTSDERLAAGCAVVDRTYKGLLDGSVDPADPADTSAEWTAESEKINAIYEEDFGVGLTLKDFWLNVVRVSELEHEHLYAAHSYKVLQGRAYEQTRMDCQNGDVTCFYKELLEPIRLSSIDMGNGNVIPGITPTWCRLNWVRFGAATITHHTAAARRQLLFHHHSLRGVSALAHLNYGLQPLSASLDYSSPFRYRQSYVALCAAYGVDMARADHYYNVSGLAKLGAAEEAMGIINETVKNAYGARRRELTAKARAANQRLLPITNPVATILPPASNTEEDPSSTAASAATSGKQKWAFGGKRTIKYSHQSPYLAELAAAHQAAQCGGGGEAIVRAAEVAKKAIVQVALMRRSTAESKKMRSVEANYLAGEAAKLIERHPELADVRDEAIRFCELATGGITDVDLSKHIEENPFTNAADGSEWEFVTMIADNIPLSTAQTLDVTLPFAASSPSAVSSSSSSSSAAAAAASDFSVLEGGDYCLRLRFVDTVLNPSCDPSRVVEAWTPAFEAHDAVSPALRKHLSLPEEVGTLLANKRLAVAADDAEGLARLDRYLAVDGNMLIPLCAALRKVGVEVPLQVEFNAGQVLTPKGQFYVDVLLELLWGGKYGAAKVLNDGLTEVQLELEDRVRNHWALCSFVGATAEEWGTVRRYVLEDAMEAEAEWWRADDWLEGEMEDATTLPSRQRYADQLCTLLSARSNNGGYNMREMMGLVAEGRDAKTGLRLIDTSATVSGDGAVSALSFDTHAVREKNFSIDELLANAQQTINSANFRLNTLAGRKRQTFCKNKIVTTFSECNRTVFGGKYGKAAQFAFSKALEEAALSAPTLTVEGGLRGLKAVDRFASEDNHDLRSRTWDSGMSRYNVGADIRSPERESSWGTNQ